MMGAGARPSSSSLGNAPRRPRSPPGSCHSTATDVHGALGRRGDRHPCCRARAVMILTAVGVILTAVVVILTAVIS